MKSVLFIDPPAFATTVAALADPSLRRRPVAIAPLGADRAVVRAVSREAAALGVTRGMAVALARRVCPDLVVLPPEPRQWARAHRALHAILARVAPVIEPRGYGHAYLDITGTERLFGPAVDVARRLEREARAELGIPLAVGVAVNKLVSETAAAVVKREAGADIWPVAHGREAPFLAPEAVAVLPDVPTRVRERLDDYHLVRVGQVAAIGEQALQTAFGREGRTLHRHAHGIDLRPVIPPEIQAECRVGHTLATDTNDRRALHALLRPMAERLGRRLRERSFAAGRLVIAIRHVDDATASRGITLPPGVLDLDLWRAACRALDAARTRRTAVRSLALIADRLHDGHGQLDLWGDPIAEIKPKDVALQRAMDQMRRAEGGRRRVKGGG